MAIITDPDLLTCNTVDDGTAEVFINTTTKRIKLNVVGNLSNDGVTGKCLYSFLRNEWNARAYAGGVELTTPFFMTALAEDSFEFDHGWDFESDATRYLIRTTGWTVRNTSGAVTQKWAGILGLGALPVGQLHYQQAPGGELFDFRLVGQVGQINQAVQILRDDDGDGVFAEASDFDRRGYFKLFVREGAQLYDDVSLADIGVTAMDAIAYRFPLNPEPWSSSHSRKMGIEADND